MIHVLQATLDRAIAERVPSAQIAGMQPAVGIDRVGGRSLPEFRNSQADVIAAGAKLDDLADSGVLPVCLSGLELILVPCSAAAGRWCGMYAD